MATAVIEQDEKYALSTFLEEDFPNSSVYENTFIDSEIQKTSEYIPTSPDGDQYEHLEFLGKGGMGVVQSVLDKKLNRRLAMKMIHSKSINSKEAISRFVEEAHICAQLQHPNIVPIHDIGTLPDGRLYFTMREIKGRTLKSVIRSFHESLKNTNQSFEDWNLHRMVDVLLKVCQAVAYAHSKGVIHRDLKPDNIMLGEFGEVLVLDWGLAKIFGDTSQSNSSTEELFSFRQSFNHNTLMGEIAGTPSYMAPEQAYGELAKQNVLTDVYALGCILYAIISGRSPYRGTSPLDILNKVKNGPPLALSSMMLSINVPEELIQACEVAMSRSQSDRYSSVEELADVLRFWLEGSKNHEKALIIVEETKALSARRSMLDIESEEMITKAKEALDQIPKWANEGIKEDYWLVEREGLEKQRESKRLNLDIEHRLFSALSYKNDLIEAHELLVQRYLKSHSEAERDRDNESLFQSELRLQYHTAALPKGNQMKSKAFTYLKGLGAVSLQCEVDDVDIFLDKYVPYRRRIVPKRIGYLGKKSLVQQTLEMGTYRLVLKKPGHIDVIYPIHIGRGEHWDGYDENGVRQLIHIPRLNEVSLQECFIPQGWFGCGGDDLAPRSLEKKRLWMGDFVISRFPVTNREYLVFLNSLLANGQEEDALKWVPRQRAGHSGEQGAMLYGRNPSGHFILVPDAVVLSDNSDTLE